MITVQKNNAPSTQNPAQKGVQFLSPRHVPAGGILRLQVTKVTTDKPDNFGNPYIVYFADGSGQKYSKGFKGTSYNLISLVEQLGEDERKWAKRMIDVSIHEEDGQQQLRFNVVGK